MVPTGFYKNLDNKKAPLKRGFFIMKALKKALS